MEKPADPATSANAGEQSPDRKTVRRRFVQSTLFPLKSHDTQVDKKETKKVDLIDLNDDVDDDECCGSQGGMRKRGRKSKPNSTPQKRRSKRVANGKESPITTIDGESPNDESPQQLKEKCHTSPRNGRTTGNKRTSAAKIPSSPVGAHQTSQPVPDLRLEAKKTAEENSRLFAGKQLHPFFSSWKVGKKDLETTEVESNGCLDKQKERKTEFGPIHVLENVKDDLEHVDWSNCSFYDGTIFGKTTWDLERRTSSFQTSIVTTKFDTINDTNPLGLSLLLKDMSEGMPAGIHETTSVIPRFVSALAVDKEVTPHNMLKNLEKDFEVDKPNFITENIDCLNLDLEQRNAIFLERVMSYYLNRGNHPVNSLWTNKYQPEKALEVCGNSDSVKLIHEWLHLWSTTDFHVRKSSSGVGKCLIREDDCHSYDGDSDAENVGEACGLKNVLLVTGPVGSGKSAAIYACAKEQGFQVVEVNASDWRNGALLKQKFGEAVGSHWLKRSQETPVCSQSNLVLKSSLALSANVAADLDLNHGLVEVISSSEGEDSAADVGLHSVGDGILPSDQNEIKTLILFEDVDATLCEDRGFISTIQLLADTGKRPMILTSNSENPVLPDNLEREEVCFTLPPLKELVHHTYLICAAEKTELQPHLIQRCIQLCRGDIRKTLMHLQFWCQSERWIEDGKVQSKCSPLMFNVEAGHFTLPKLLNCELPSSLSEFVEAEIAKSLCGIKMEENHSSLEVIEEEGVNTCMQNSLDSYKDETTSIEAKKEEILKGNCFLHVDNDLIAISNTQEFSNSSGSPVAFTRRNRRRKLDTVLSDSEDEISGHENLAITIGLRDDGNTVVPDVDSNFPFHCATVVDASKTSGDLLCRSGAVNAELVKQSTENADQNQISFAVVGDSCNQSIDGFFPYADVSFANHLVDVNQSSVVANDSLNPLNDQLLHSGEGKLEVNRNQFPVVGYDLNFCATIGSGNQSTDQTIHLGLANAVSSEMENVNERDQAVADHLLNPLNHQLQHCREAKKSVNRCLFSGIPCTDAINCTVGSTWNQSTDHGIQRGEASMTELQHLCMEKVNVDHCKEAVDDSLNPLFNQFLLCERENMENLEHIEAADVFPLSHPAMGDFFNSSSEFHIVEANAEEIKHQNVEMRNNSRISCPVLGGLNLLSDQFIGIGGLGIQQQCSGSADVRPTSFIAVGNSLKQSSDQVLEIVKQEMQQLNPGCAEVNPSSSSLDDCKKQNSSQFHFAEKRLANVQHQLDTANVDLLSKSMNPLNGKILRLSEANLEVHQCEYSEATNGIHGMYPCQSVDISCVPESTFVPETEVNDGKELQSAADLTEIVSPVAAVNVDSSVLRHKGYEHVHCDNYLNLTARDDEMGDSQSESEHFEPSTSGCQVMDECSRMDFRRRTKSSWNSKLVARNPVQDRWNELRKTELRHHFNLETKVALEVVELTCGICNLISETDLLLHDCKPLVNDSVDQEVDLDEEAFAFGWHDQQIQMASTAAEHGYCLYAKEFDTLQSKMGLDNRVLLAWEMLASTNNSMALGKLLRLDRSQSHSSLAERSLKLAAPTVDISSKRERETCLQSIVLSAAPLRSLLSLRGNAFHDYLTSLTHISRLEASRFAEVAEKRKHGRVRMVKNYLSSGGLDLSPEDISMLMDYHSFGKVLSASTDAISR